MNIRERIVKALFGDVIEDEVRKSSKQVISHVMGLSGSEGILPDIDFEIFNQMYEQTSTVRAVVNVICKAVTARGYTVAPAKPGPDPKNAETLQEFFANCNPNDTLLEIVDDITRDVYVFGNAFLEVVYGPNGKPRELWNLDATSMRVVADEQEPFWATSRSDSLRASKVNFDPGGHPFQARDQGRHSLGPLTPGISHPAHHGGQVRAGLQSRVLFAGL